MFCSKCGKELPDDSVFCNACGHQISEVMKTEPVAKEKPKKKKKPVNKKAVKTAAIISGVVLGIAAILCALLFVVIPYNAHAKAEKLYNNNQYVEAYQAYIDAYRKPMNGFVNTEEVSNCGFKVIDTFIEKGDAQGAFEFLYKYSKDNTMEGGWIINDIIFRLSNRNANIIDDTTVQEKLCENILKIVSDGKYCVFDKNNVNSYCNSYMIEYDVLLLKYMLSALPTDNTNNIPSEIYGQLLESYTVCSKYYSDYRMQIMFPQEDLSAYLNGFTESCDLDSKLVNRCRQQWTSDYQISSSEISNIQIKYETVEAISSYNSFTLTGLIILTYDQNRYSESFSIIYTWDDKDKRYEEESSVYGGFFGCFESGKIQTYTFSSTVSFTHPETYGNSKVVLEFDGSVLRKKTYDYNGYLSNTDTATYSMIITPTTYTITATFYNGLNVTMWYDRNGNYIVWGQDVYL